MNNKELNNTSFHMSQGMGKTFNVNCTFLLQYSEIHQWFIKNYQYALHVSDAHCVHLQEHYKL